MLNMSDTSRITMILLIASAVTCSYGPTSAAVRLEGQVQAGVGPVANSTVTLWGANTGEPRQLAQAITGSDGRFMLGTDATLGADVILYTVAKGGGRT